MDADGSDAAFDGKLFCGEVQFVRQRVRVDESEPAGFEMSVIERGLARAIWTRQSDDQRAQVERRTHFLLLTA